MSGSWQAGWVAGDIVTAAELAKASGSVFDSTLSVAAATIDTGAVLPTTYGDLEVTLYARGDTAATSTTLALRLNHDSAANYNAQILQTNNATLTGSGAASATSLTIGSMPAATAPANAFGMAVVTVASYGLTTNFKTMLGQNYYEIADTGAGQVMYQLAGMWKAAAAVTRVEVICGAGNFAAGSRLTVRVKGAS